MDEEYTDATSDSSTVPLCEAVVENCVDAASKGRTANSFAAARFKIVGSFASFGVEILSSLHESDSGEPVDVLSLVLFVRVVGLPGVVLCKI